MMLEYWTGISQPPNSTRRAPSFWWAAKSGVRFRVPICRSIRCFARKNNRCREEFCAGLSSPFLSLQLFFADAQLMEDKLFGKFDQFVGTAGIKDGVRQIVHVFFDPIGIDSAAPASPGIFGGKAGAGYVEIEVLV